jgi:hypothetical protein
MDDVVESARQMADWRAYVQRYPLVFVGAAAVAGFVMVPKRGERMTPDVDKLLELAKRNGLAGKSNPQSQESSGLTTTLISLIAGAALRAGVGLAGQHLRKIVSEVSRPTDA